MTYDPFKDYASKMQDVQVSGPLFERVIGHVDQERARQTTRVVAGTRRSGRAAQPHARAKRTRTKALAFAACLAVLAAVVGVSLMWPRNPLMGTVTDNFAFQVKAYGAVDDALLPSGSNGVVYFNCETETQRLLPLDPDDPDRYANEGFYTGCVFNVKGEGIVRVQANVSKGELYRVTSKAYSRLDDPVLAAEANSWKPTKIGQGELLGKYDYVAGVLFYGGIYEDGENVGKDRNDPSHTAKVNLYQRLGATVDTDAMDDPEENTEDYAFGLWTNEPFDATFPDPAFDYDYDPDANINAALDTLDGTQLTVTVTFDDGTCATQVIDLHAADFKANVITVAANGMNTVLELVPEIMESPAQTDSEKAAAIERGIASIHTLYGLVSEQNDDPFPCGEATWPYLTVPLTEPLVIPPAPEPTDEERAAASSLPPGPTFDADDLGDWGTVFEDTGHTTVFEKIERLDALPDGLGLTDLVPFYQAGGDVDPTIDHVDAGHGDYTYTIAADGSLSPGFSYVQVTKTITNTKDEENDVFVVEGSFIKLEQDGDAYRSTSVSEGEAVWRSGHDGPGWDSHIWFQLMAPGETRQFTILYILPDDVLANPNLAFCYHGQADMPDSKALRVGPLL